ncbi:MAG: hypothetical protein K9K66_14125 [Desulfarculaceae bacterium]|nr:hypothetical protein [Desulfarculaceae bacterium]MCF8074208.1 hypothetical protein [Desulfarculaceae bacterium]MCF8102789.1 hypothetical protein [Desulfarculaceae bacterium]MCF8116356.1 hypothetical protein [Desulfarculaceae bacterium]
MRWFAWLLLIPLLAGGLEAAPAWSAPPVRGMGLTAEITVRSGGKLVFSNLCAAERCAVCRDLVKLYGCDKPKLQIKYVESDTSLPLDRVRAIEFHKKAPGSSDFYPATVTLRNGKKFKSRIRVRKQVIPVTFCGVNDIGTVSCLGADKVKTLLIR